VSTTGLERRVTALEAAAEEDRLRPMRVLAQERGLDVGRVQKIYEECRARAARLRAEGKSEREIVEAAAAGLGIEPDTLLRRAQEIAERFGL
jgi:DNA-binding transcriptional MocR family regulator